MSSIGSRSYVITVVLCLGSILSGCGYNTIPTKEEQAKARWSDVQNQYQRRAVDGDRADRPNRVALAYSVVTGTPAPPS
jgi:hypothetical protein